MATGAIKTTKPAGYGFIAVDDGPDLFFHRDELPPGMEFGHDLRGRRVEFDIRQGRDGRRRATSLKAAP